MPLRAKLTLDWRWHEGFRFSILVSDITHGGSGCGGIGECSPKKRRSDLNQCRRRTTIEYTYRIMQNKSIFKKIFALLLNLIRRLFVRYQCWWCKREFSWSKRLDAVNYCGYWWVHESRQSTIEFITYVWMFKKQWSCLNLFFIYIEMMWLK